MSLLAICDQFKWKLDDVYNLPISEYKGVVKYMKKLVQESKKAMRKSKSRGRKR